MTDHHIDDLICIFNQCYLATYNTELKKGEDEPLYLPADGTRVHHELYFARGFFASALHECAHWLIAGEKRRLQVDFGYWYVPDGRSLQEQELFFKVEVKPQAMEWILSVASGFRFQISSDNLNGLHSDTLKFKQAVYEQVGQYCKQGLSQRAELLRSALCQFYHTPPLLKYEDFTLDSL